MAGYQILTGLGKKSKSFITNILKFLLYGFLIILAIVILKGILKTDELVIQPISAPKTFVESGFQGNIIAQRIHEEIESLYLNSSTIREDSTFINVDQSKDINMNVMGLGVSASNIIYHLRDLLGIQTNYISGHLTDLNQTLSLKIAISDPKDSRTIRLPYTEDRKLEVFDSLLFEGAKYVTEKQNPYRLAVYYHQNGNFDKSLEIIRELAKSPGEKKWAFNLWANIIKLQNGSEASIEFYKEALKEEPNFELALRNLGNTYFFMDSIKLAIKYFERAIEIEPDNWSTINMLAFINSRHGDLEKAKEYYKLNLERNPKNINSYDNYAGFLIGQNEHEDLPKLFELAKDQHFEHADFYTIKSGYYQFLEKLDSAEFYADKALLFEPNNIEALASKVNIVAARDGEEASIPHMKRIIKEFEIQKYFGDGYLNSLNSLAVTEYLIGDLDSALIHVNKALNLSPNNGLYLSTLSEIYYLQGHKDKFYETIIQAFENGLIIKEDWWDDIPYSNLKGDIRLMEIMNIYQPPLPDSGDNKK